MPNKWDTLKQVLQNIVDNDTESDPDYVFAMEHVLDYMRDIDGEKILERSNDRFIDVMASVADLTMLTLTDISISCYALHTENRENQIVIYINSVHNLNGEFLYENAELRGKFNGKNIHVFDVRPDNLLDTILEF